MKGKEEEKRRKRREIRRFEKRKQNAALVSVTSVRKEKTQRKNTVVNIGGEAESRHWRRYL